MHYKTVNIVCIALIVILFSYFSYYVYTTQKYNASVYEFLEWNSQDKSAEAAKKLLSKYKHNLKKISTDFEDYTGINLFGQIYNSYVFDWESSSSVINFLNLWDEAKNSSYDINDDFNPVLSRYLTDTSNSLYFIWGIRTDNKNIVKKAALPYNGFLGKAKQEYLKLDNREKFFSRLKKEYPPNIIKCKYSSDYLELMEASALNNNDYKTAILANTDDIKLAENESQGKNKLSLFSVSNIAKYSYLMNKIPEAARKIIVDFYRQNTSTKDKVKELTESIRGKCIADVVKKYNLLKGKPKNGYYYPVNDMKINVVSRN